MYDLSLTRCPGMYCGRTLLTSGNWSRCGACPRGFRSNGSSICLPCEDSPTFYDWLYLGFMALLGLVLHWFCIDTVSQRRRFNKGSLILHFSAFFETLGAAIFTLLLTEPLGSFNILSCNTQKLSDWYTLMHNPSPNYENTLHCTQEAVYPLYTIVFVFYAFAVFLMLLIRPFMAKKFLPAKGKYSVYAALYFFPILAMLHAVGSGLIYYSFPYITIILSVLSSATHFSYKLNQHMKVLFMNSVTDVKNIVVNLGHCLIHAYGIIAIASLQGIDIHPAMLALVPLPAAFYILTVKFTDPHKIHYE
ncbi:hypothetical protein TKK_0005884 [Trichogramma kaykai]|uniref:JNK1/MAPK8-associated membrane protein n=1 Tax=Trichogramma kaykai TaxID=54128 RepID=A0ABD2XGH2_9HYME